MEIGIAIVKKGSVVTGVTKLQASEQCWQCTVNNFYILSYDSAYPFVTDTYYKICSVTWIKKFLFKQDLLYKCEQGISIVKKEVNSIGDDKVT